MMLGNIGVLLLKEILSLKFKWAKNPRLLFNLWIPLFLHFTCSFKI